MNRIFKTIRAKMIILFSSTLFIAIALQIGFNAIYSEGVYVKGRMSELEGIYYHIATDFSPDVANIYDRITDYEDLINLRVLIFNENGTIIYQTLSNQVNKSLASRYSLSDQGKVIKNFLQYPQVYIVNSYRNEAQTIAIRGAVTHNKDEYYIILETPISAITEATKMFTKISIYSGLIAMAFGAVFIYYFSYRLSKPISEISVVAKNVSNLNFTKKVKTTKKANEINDLALNINFMSEQLEKLISDLQIANLELKKDNDLKKQVDDMRREFIANVSHELKTPLSVMQGYAEILKADLSGIDKDFYYDVIVDESKHMNELVRRLLNISSIENGLTKLSKTEFSLSDISKKIVEKNKQLVQNIDVKFLCTLENTTIFADKLLIEQAITNFLSNALTYVETEIIVEVSENKNNYRVTVFNDGPSIDAESFDKIWFSFYREDKSRTRNKDKNFGLGLYIIKTILEAHNGNVGVYNCSDGVCFWFELEKFDEFE